MDTDADAAVTVLTADACWGLLRSADVGRLAVSVAGEPDIFPINYVVDHGTIVFRTAPGTKLAAVVVGQAVAFEVDSRDLDAGEAWSVVIKGHGEQITRSQELIDTSDLPLFPWQAGPKHRFVRILPDVISGRRFHVVDRAEWETPLTNAPRSSLD